MNVVLGLLLLRVLGVDGLDPGPVLPDALVAVVLVDDDWDVGGLLLLDALGGRLVVAASQKDGPHTSRGIRHLG